MTLQPVTLRLPVGLYRQAAQHARSMSRSVEDELTAVLETVLTTSDNLAGVPSDIAIEVTQLRFLDDEHLWRAAQKNASPEKSERMQYLMIKQQAEGLTQPEQQEVEQLLRLANLVMLIRAEAAVLLKERGHDIASLRRSPPGS